MYNLIAEGTTQAPHALPMAPGAFGLLAIGTFAVLLAVLFAFRNVSNRH
jgi:hypothetical protein